MKGRTKRQRAAFAVLTAIVLFLAISGWGIIASGKLSVTIIHIPIIIGTIVLGLPEGLALAGIFGISTMMRAASYPEGSLDALFQNPLVSVWPRLMIPVVVRLVWKGVRRIADDHTVSAALICSGFTAVFGVLANVTFVMSALVALYPARLGITDSVSASATVVTNMIGYNVVFEILTAVLCACAFVPALQGWLGERRENADKPIRKTFQKWLLLFITLAFFAMLFFFYNMQTRQDVKGAEKLMQEKCGDVLRMLQLAEGQDVGVRLTVGESGAVLLIKDGVIVSGGMEEWEGKSASFIGLDADKTGPGELTGVEIDGAAFTGMYRETDDYIVFVLLPDSEIYAERNELAVLLLGGLLCLFLLMYANISRLVQKNVVHKIQDVNDSLAQIRKGNLEEKVSVLGNTEFAALSEGINATVNALKETMEEVAARMNQEMEFARQIQHSALPVTEQVAPKKKEYEIRGVMEAAREVGGDFYDYFLIEENKLGIVIADVSGKGVPAALFMMTAKTLIKNFVLNGKSPAEALQLANAQLCENNEAGMFVTVWLGVLDYDAGELEFANAGHNPPLFKKRGEPFFYMDHKRYKRSIMLGMREGIAYRNNRISFTRGDMLCLYTDGVTEANNSEGELYGEERLKRCVENHWEKEPEELIRAIREDIDRFVQDAEQFDDITMVVLKMNAEWKETAVEAVYENTAGLAAFVEENLPQECSVKIRRQIAVAFDEVYSNVVKYSRAKQLVLRLGILKDTIYLEFTDDGIPYNPLECGEPDLRAPREERPVGGLGLFVVKRIMDEMEYQYRDEKNRFTIGKKFL